MVEQTSAAGTVGVAVHKRLEQSYAALSDQFEAANEVLVALGRSAGDPDTVLTRSSRALGGSVSPRPPSSSCWKTASTGSSRLWG